jgi:hypothetical protein
MQQCQVPLPDIPDWENAPSAATATTAAASKKVFIFMGCCLSIRHMSFNANAAVCGDRRKETYGGKDGSEWD